MTIDQWRADGLFLVGWVLSAVFGYSVGFPLGLSLLGTMLWGWIIGGGITATLQWLILRPRVAQHGWWIVASMVGVSIGTLISGVTSQIAIQAAGLTTAFILVGASVGLGIGLGQWIMLKLSFRRAGWWVPISTAGYSLGLLLAVNAPFTIPFGRALVFGPEFGGSVGAISGIVTGLTLLWLLRRPITGITEAVPSETCLDVN